MDLIPLVILVLLVVFIFMDGIVIVPQQNAYVIERLGKYNRILLAGFALKIPFLERVSAKVDLRTRQAEFHIDAKTRDNVTITMQIAAQYRVSTDPSQNGQQGGIYRSVYMLANPTEQMSSYLIDALRSAVPQYTLDEVFDRKDGIARSVNQDVSTQMIDYGYIVASTLIVGIDLPQDVEAAMNQINSSQRMKEAAQNLAEADRIKVITEAKAKAEAMEQAGLGIAAQRKAIAVGIAESLAVIQASGVSAEEADHLFKFTQWIDMMENFAKSSNQSTVVLPSDFRSASSMFEQILAADAATKPAKGDA
jgi:regulator of protease activity HflC (stomatin/prohibitin superfamily)